MQSSRQFAAVYGEAGLAVVKRALCRPPLATCLRVNTLACTVEVRRHSTVRCVRRRFVSFPGGYGGEPQHHMRPPPPPSHITCMSGVSQAAMQRLSDALVAAEEARATAPLDHAEAGRLARRWRVTRHPVLRDVLMIHGGLPVTDVDYTAAAGKEVRAPRRRQTPSPPNPKPLDHGAC